MINEFGGRISMGGFDIFQTRFMMGDRLFLSVRDDGTAPVNQLAFPEIASLLPT